jgi:hypothetical protein
MSRSSGGPPPKGNGSRPVHSCEACGTMYPGGPHTCRQAVRHEPTAAEKYAEMQGWHGPVPNIEASTGAVDAAHSAWVQAGRPGRLRRALACLGDHDTADREAGG